MIRLVCNLLVFGAALVSIHTIAGAQENQIKTTQVKPTSSVSGAQMFKEYCAVCHGPSGKGDGPVATALKVPPPDLTTLAKRHEGKFPADYVSTVLLFGPGTTAHGSPNMPTWGPIFEYMDSHNQSSVQQRIKNLCDYLASLQEK